MTPILLLRATPQNKHPDCDLYELEITDQHGRSLRWRVYVQPEAHLPVETQIWSKLPIDDEFSLGTITQITYPTAADLDQLQTQWATP